MDPLRLLCVLAHPDDESMGTGGILAKYAAEGVETHLVTATHGERGWMGPEDEDPGLDAMAEIREAELRAAGAVLGLSSLAILDYVDGDLDRADPAEAVGRIVPHLRRIRPQVVVSFGPDGAYGHPDHIAICQLTTAAVACAADPTYAPDAGPPHRVAKLYYMVVDAQHGDDYAAAFGDITMDVDGVVRKVVIWPDWAVSTVVDTTAYWETVWRAVRCHRSQLPELATLEQLPLTRQADLWGRQPFYRAFSTVDVGRGRETDLFAGLRKRPVP